MTQQAAPKNPAEAYEQYFVPAMFRPWSAILLRHAAPQPGERVLDIACGTGIVAREAAPLVGAEGQVTGLDMNPAMLAVASAQAAPTGARIQWQQGDAMALPFADGSFDLVLCQHGLQFFPNRAEAVEEMHRVLAPNGRVAVIVLQKLNRHPVFEALMTSVAKHLAIPLTLVTTPFALPNAEVLRTMFLSAGFKTLEITPEKTVVRFPGAAHFVPMAVASSAAAIPAFGKLGEAGRESLIEAVRADVQTVLDDYRQDNEIAFPMYAHVAVGEV